MNLDEAELLPGGSIWLDRPNCRPSCLVSRGISQPIYGYLGLRLLHARSAATPALSETMVRPSLI